MKKKRYYMTVKSNVTKEQYFSLVQVKKEYGIPYSEVVRKGIELYVGQLENEKRFRNTK